MTYPIDRETLATHLDGLRRLARSLVRDDHEADDVLQDAAVVALESQVTLRAGPRAWLGGVTRTLARRTARSAGRRRRHEQAAARPEALPSTADVVVRAAEQSRLLDLVVQMEEPYRTALLLRFVEDLPPREIAQRQGLPVETVRTQVKRGLARLRGRLDEAHEGRTGRWRASLAVIAGLPAAGAETAVPAPLWAVPLAGLLLAASLLFYLSRAEDTDPDRGLLETAKGLTHAEGPPSDAPPRDPQVTLVPPAEPREPLAPAAAVPATAEKGSTPPAPRAVPKDMPRGAPSVDRPLRTTAGSTFSYSDNGYPILDPAHASPLRLNDERLILAIQECLTVLDAKTGKARPGAAENWTSSADGRTWTFKLRKGARWSDSSPVTAQDFVRSWVRVMDPFTESPWTALFRSVRGCATISDNSGRADGFVALRNGLKGLMAANPSGVPGATLLELLRTTGVRPYLEGVKGRALSHMLKWKSGDVFPPEMVKKAISALNKEKKRVRSLYRDALEELGKAGSGVEAKDDLTLVVRTHGAAPFLPKLLARSAFAPLHKSIHSLRSKAFEAENYVTSGPFLLAGRGAKPPENEPNRRTLSVVELVRNPTYKGRHPAQVEHIKCFTDQDESGQSGKEDVRRYETGDLQWINATWPERPRKSVRKKIQDLEGYSERSTPTVLFMRLRCDRAPFQDKEARRAFALAVDRASLAKRFWPGADPAFRFVPPGIEGRTDDLLYPRPDANGAKAAFKAAELDGDLWLEIILGEAPGHDDVARTLVNGWKRVLGIEPPGFQITPENELRNIRRAGGYQVMLTAYRGFVDDPYAYLAPLHSKDADSGLGWRDTAYDALIDAAGDPDIALEDPKGWLKKAGQPELGSALTAAKSSLEGRMRLRREALAAAEQRLLNEFVIVPLLFLKEATLLRDAEGLGSDEARRNPGFVGSLRSVQR